MDPFSLSERWNGWRDLGVIVQAARAAIAAGPFDPVLCEIALEGSVLYGGGSPLVFFLPPPPAGEQPLLLDIYVAHVVDAEASLRLVYNGRWLQIYGAGSDWSRAKAAYDAAQVEISLAYGITTFKLPQLPVDTVQDVRRGFGHKDRDPGRLGGDVQPPRPGV